ncbi:hypothetical protein [Streptomyces sp. P9-A4]|uniref:hypothetical protein n=1 Tax=Streptomyces sp. P9-A4 TaxID=3072285 RepID=UPI002FC5CFC7
MVRAIKEAAADDFGRVRNERALALSWYAFSLEYMEARWVQVAAKTRSETNDALCSITEAMLRRTRGRPDDELLRRALRNWAFVVPRPDVRKAPTEVRLALGWVARASRPLDDLLDPAVMRGVLQALRLKRDGTVAAAETQRRKRMTFVNAVRYAIELGQLRADPLANISWRITETVPQVDPRVVVNPVQARSLLCAVSYVGGYGRARGRRLVGLFAGMYYGGCGRPKPLRLRCRTANCRQRGGAAWSFMPTPLRRQEVDRQRPESRPARSEESPAGRHAYGATPARTRQPVAGER